MKRFFVFLTYLAVLPSSFAIGVALGFYFVLTHNNQFMDILLKVFQFLNIHV